MLLQLLTTSISAAVVDTIPLFKLNFYMMGMSDVDESVTLDIGRNIDYLNNEFENRIIFEIGKMFIDENHAYIPDLHDAAIGLSLIHISEPTRPY